MNELTIYGNKYRQSLTGDWSLESVAHAEGRVVWDEEGNSRYEYALRDHLGNTHILFSDLDGDGKLTLFDDPSTEAEEVVEAYQESHYYPFGMLMEGPFSPTLDIPNNYLYNTKELNSDFGLDWYDYGARWHDPAIGRWGAVDPLAEKYSPFSPYNYTLNNPVRFVDPDGMGVTGDYYKVDGTYIGSDGEDDDKVYVVDSEVDYELPALILFRIGGTNIVSELDVSASELELLAASAYGESSVENVQEEMYGIASAIMNNFNARGGDNTLSEVVDDIVNASNDGNDRFGEFSNTSKQKRNENSGMKLAVAAAINAADGGVDYSNGATGWDGSDLRSNSHRFGLNISNPAHDIYNVGDRPLKKKENGSLYRRQTTAAYGGTVFMRIHPDFVKGGGRGY